MVTFCKDCKHFRSFHHHRYDELCKHKSNIETIIGYDAYHYKFRAYPSEINSSNNCSNFEPSLFYKVKRFLFKGKN